MAIVASQTDSVLTGSTGESWQMAMKGAIRDSHTLCRHLQLPDHQGEAADCGFPVFAPLAYVHRMRSGDPDDPLLRQVLPVSDESRQRLVSPMIPFRTKRRN